MDSGPIPVMARNRPSRSGSAAMKVSAVIASLGRRLRFLPRP
jgi:hypothetical protein